MEHLTTGAVSPNTPDSMLLLTSSGSFSSGARDVDRFQSHSSCLWYHSVPTSFGCGSGPVEKTDGQLSCPGEGVVAVDGHENEASSRMSDVEGLGEDNT